MRTINTGSHTDVEIVFLLLDLFKEYIYIYDTNVIGILLFTICQQLGLISLCSVHAVHELIKDHDIKK